MSEAPKELGAIAQLGEHLLCKQGVGGSIPPGSTRIHFKMIFVSDLARAEYSRSVGIVYRWL